MDTLFRLRVSFCDSAHNAFVTLGGAGFDSQAEWQAQWDSIPGADLGYDDPWKLTLDKLDAAGDLVDERPISRPVAERLMGEPLEDLIARGRAATCFTWAQAKAAIEAMAATHH
jgi:hypothetical protein